MSQLRDIMQRLGARRAEAAASAAPPGRGTCETDYARHLQNCTTAMLHYEWAWLEQHLETLELSLTQPSMLTTLGGEGKVRALLAEGDSWREALRSRLEARGESPGDRHGPVLASEHAWELTHPTLREHWGLA